jgi:RNA polymerase sigma-70 factor (ECF subfamily)
LFWSRRGRRLAFASDPLFLIGIGMVDGRLDADVVRTALAGLSDAVVVRRVLAGEPALFEVLMRRYNQRVFRAIRSLLRDEREVEDAMQQAYVDAYQHLGAFEGRAKFSTWLTRIAINEALSRKRRGVTTVELSAIEHQQASPGQVIQFPMMHQELDPERGVAQREIRRILERAIDALPSAFRAVFVLRIVEGLSLEETSDLLGIKIETVKTRLHRARSLLKKAIDHELVSALSEAFPFAGTRCERITDRVLQRLNISG